MSLTSTCRYELLTFTSHLQCSKLITKYLRYKIKNFRQYELYFNHNFIHIILLTIVHLSAIFIIFIFSILFSSFFFIRHHCGSLPFASKQKLRKKSYQNENGMGHEVVNDDHKFFNASIMLRWVGWTTTYSHSYIYVYYVAIGGSGYGSTLFCPFIL